MEGDSNGGELKFDVNDSAGLRVRSSYHVIFKAGKKVHLVSDDVACWNNLELLKHAEITFR